MQTELSPATLFLTETNYIGFFTELKRYGLGAPSYVAFSTRGGPRAFKNGERLDPAEMEENWVMVWFAGARGWTNGDNPCVVYLQHKPRRMLLDASGLHFYFAGSAGDTVLLPLYGSYRPPAEGNDSPVMFAGKRVKTWEWPKVLTREPLMRVRYWASALREFPIYCEETFSVDRSTDSVTIRQKLHYHSINDDWGTKHLKLIPVSPILGLALKERQFPMKFSRAVLDLEMPTPYGLYVAAEGEAALDATFSILQAINEARQTTVVPKPDADSQRTDTWAFWSPPYDCIDAARRAYRAGDIDDYNYACYLFARLFARQRWSADTQTPGQRLIPSANPSPFVPGIERVVKGPNPPVVQSIEITTDAWPRVTSANGSWTVGHVKVSSDRPPSRVEREAVSWNTEALHLFP